MDYRELKDQYAGKRIFLCGNGPTMNLLTKRQKKTLTEREYTFAGSRFFEWKEGWTPSFYVLTERQQATEYQERGFENATATVARFFVNWQPAPDGWVAVPRPPHHAHDVLHYGMLGLLGVCEQAQDLGPHLHHGKDTPLAMAQLAHYMGFAEMYLLGCESTKGGHQYDAGHMRIVRADGLIDPYYERAARELPIKDCTPGGNLSQRGILEYIPLDEVLKSKDLTASSLRKS